MPDFDLGEYKAKLEQEIALQQIQLEDPNMPHEYTQFHRGQINAYREALKRLDQPGTADEPAITNPYPT